LFVTIGLHGESFHQPLKWAKGRRGRLTGLIKHDLGLQRLGGLLQGLDQVPDVGPMRSW
jgi:hypothetical protein